MLVKFNTDIYPYCKGDVVNLSNDEQARVDEAVKARDIETPYVEVKAEKAEEKSRRKSRKEIV